MNWALLRAWPLWAALAGAILSPAFAATDTATFQVSITIQSECQITTTNDLDFGTQGVLSANIDQTTTFDVQCTDTTTYDIGLNAGTGSGATVAMRLMTGPGSATVAYSLYQDPAHNDIWGNTIPTDTVPGTGDGTAQSYTVYGQVPPQTTPGVGLYTDTITITVTF